MPLSRCCIFGSYAHVRSFTTQTVPVAATAVAASFTAALPYFVQTGHADRNVNIR